MRKILCSITLAFALLGSAAGCGSSAPNQSGLPPENQPPAGNQEPESDSGSTEERLAAYRTVLEDILYRQKFPDGENHAESSGEDGNQFAVYDVDQDGREELIIYYTNTAQYSGKIAFVVDYNGNSVFVQLAEFPLLAFYDNGVVQADWSHNQGKAGEKFWPYTFWRYDPAADCYVAAEMADSWDKSMVEEGFPESADTDGNGIVYYIMQYGNYDTSQPVDGEAYQQWRESYLGGAEELILPFVPFTEENIQALQ